MPLILALKNDDGVNRVQKEDWQNVDKKRRK